MHLKSLTLRGFKSFADPTVLEFEPGVTVVVGPNGSGKSNVVDAVAWVLGAQGPRVVRSTRMDDVIFAGTSARPALGRAEVSLTIDNGSRTLPIDLAEVTITRTLFRTGESEYSMNGAPCRLLDIQEMLSDAGVGRQQHVIVSQGQLAAVLDARPEDRRAVIEEAAGVLKFRRRRERSERRLEATEANLVRLQDLLREVRRQLRPLERQAEAARRHGSLVSELDSLRLYVAGRELESLERRMGETAERLSLLSERERSLNEALARLDATVVAAEARLDEEQSSDVVSVLARAERLSERAHGVGNLVAERRLRVAGTLRAAADADVVASLEAEHARLCGELAAADEAALALAPEWEQLRAGEAEHARAEALAPEAAAGPGSPEERVLAARAGRDALAAELAGARERLARSAERGAALERQTEDLDRRHLELVSALEGLAELAAVTRDARSHAEDSERGAAKHVAAAESRSRELDRRAEALRVRAEALEGAMDEAHARAGLETLANRPGVLGTLLDLVDVEEGYELAFEAAAGECLAAVVIDGLSDARAALAHLSLQGLPGTVLPTSFARGRPEPSSKAAAGGEPLRPHVRAANAAVASLLDRLLDKVIVCSTGIGDALDLAEWADPDVTVVTTGGDRLAASGWRLGAGGTGATRAALEALQAEQQEVSREAAGAEEAAVRAREEWSRARGAAAEAITTAAAAGAALEERSAQREELEHQLGRLASEAKQLGQERRDGEEAAERLEALLVEGESGLADEEAAAREARLMADEAARARRVLGERALELAGVRADLEVRAAGSQERRAYLRDRREELERRLAEHEAARSGASERRMRQERHVKVLGLLAGIVGEEVAKLDRVLEVLRERCARHEQAVTTISELLDRSRHERAEATHELTGVRELVQRGEIERTELGVRLETSIETLRHELDVEASAALSAECPELPPGMSPAARVRELEREVRLLGPINPLALQELEALEERDRFLSGQLEDVRASRRELARVIKAVDEEIAIVFSEAFADVSRHFEQLFETLFPGGTGSLRLLEPGDPLTSGVEIDARPSGRSVRRLSLLSGGERSLVALAFLFAVFRSRPSPFYLMDEVEAALDDVNLHRFLDLVDEFREEAQLLIVSHQKRTMESADLIYGVTMQPGGASKVVSERLRREATASA